MSFVRQPNYFVDPAGIVPTYAWYINHTEEEEVQNSRQMSSGAPTSDIGLIPQQGEEYPLVFEWKGTIFRQVDKNEMDAWYGICQGKSIYLIDFTGSAYEILITDWNVQRVGVAWNKRGGVPWLWKYTIIMRVLTVLEGDWSFIAV
jgi:hypothetical protein